MNTPEKPPFLHRLISGLIIGPIVSINYWAGLVAIFKNHPSYWQVLFLTYILMIPFTLARNNKTPFSLILKTYFLITFLAWAVRLVGIMPNAPF